MFRLGVPAHPRLSTGPESSVLVPRAITICFRNDAPASTAQTLSVCISKRWSQACTPWVRLGCLPKPARDEVRMALGRDLVLQAIRAHQIAFVFGNPGTTELPFIQGCAEHGIPYILALHEDIAVGMAMGYARMTGRPGVVNLHVAPGLAHGLGNLYNAWKARLPIVVLVGQQHTDVLLQEPILTGDLVEWGRPVCKWAFQVHKVSDLPLALHRAFKVAQTAPPGPVLLALPPDVLLEDGEWSLPEPVHVAGPGAGPASAIDEAIRWLVTAVRPAIVAGDGVGRSRAQSLVAELAELLAAPVFVEPLATWLNFMPDHPLYLGALPAQDSARFREALRSFDLLCLIGFTSQAPVAVHDGGGPLLPQTTPTIYIHEDSWEIAKNGPATVGILGGIRETLELLVERLRRVRLPAEVRERRRRGIEEERRRRRGTLAAVAAQVPEKTSLDATRVLTTLRSLLQPPFTVVNEAVSNSHWVLQHLHFPDADSLVSGKGGGLGHSMPTALGVQLARPERKVVNIVGDGSFLYYPQTLWTAARYRLPVTFLVLNNRSYRILKQGLKTMGGPWGQNGAEPPGLDIVNPTVDFVSVAKGFGVDGYRVERADDIEAVLARALERDVPVVVDVVIDPVS